MAATQKFPGGNPQEKKLKDFNHEVGRTGAVFEQAQRAREAHQRQLNEMVEETLRIIAKTRGHGHQVVKSVRGSTKSYTASFEHEMNSLRENFRHELDDRCKRVETTFEGLEGRMEKLEADLEAQREVRKHLIEDQLGPIRDEEKRIIAALETERRARRLEEERREKALKDEVEEITVLIDKEKFAREQQSAALDRVVIAEQQKVEKRLYQAENERKALIKGIKEEIDLEARERIDKQHGVVESIGSFVKRYRGQVLKELEVQNMTVKDPHKS
jgi:phosphopantetheine adenylyltransferase